MSRLSKISPLIAIIALLFSASCEKSGVVEYSHFVSIPSSSWDSVEFCEYDIDLRNSPRTKSASDCYDIVVAVRHTEKYPFADLFLSLSSTPGLPLPSELRMAITGSSGGWLGRGALGVYTVTDTLARHIILPDSACLRIGQSMHRDKVPGILDVGVIITRSTP